MTIAVDTVDTTHEALLQFLYRAPIGLAQAALDGTVDMMNPRCAQLLMPIARSGDLDNVLTALEPIAPGLATLVSDHPEPVGVICDAMRVAVDGFHPGPPRVYAISLLKADATRLMVMLDDITTDVERERDAVARRLAAAERVDVVTHMPNRTAIAELVDAALTRASAPACDRDCGRGAVLSIGCERLQDIAAGLGHRVREQVLALMARRLRAALRPSDRVGEPTDLDPVAAHVGADEFVVLLQRIAQASDASRVAQRLLDSLSRPYVVDQHELHCAVSIGIVPLAAGDRMEALLHDAALARAEARSAGGSRWTVFDPSMRERAAHQVDIETELRRAIANDELYVVYQPVVGLRTEAGGGRLEGVEALVRWRHPRRGIVPPIDFIGVAERTGLIDALGLFVLRTACRQFRAWMDAFGDDAPALLAVNLSRAQLDPPDFVESIAAVIADTGMPVGQLQLEVTESLAAQDDGVQAKLEALKAAGIQLALDDFGTGYSSLSSLHLLPIDTVKIDRSFVTLLEESPHHRVLIEATILVARSLGMATVAEGIETDRQAAIVRELGCDKAQGYLFGKPLAAEDLGRWIVEHRAGLGP